MEDSRPDNKTESPEEGGGGGGRGKNKRKSGESDEAQGDDDLRNDGQVISNEQILTQGDDSQLIRELLLQVAKERRLREQESRLREQESRRAEAAELREQEERRLKEKERRLKEEERRLKEEERRLKSGTYFATFDELWAPRVVVYTSDDFTRMKRSTFPDFNTRDTKIKVSPFQITLSNAIKEETFVKEDQDTNSRSSHNSKNVKEKIWPVNVLSSIFKNKNDPSMFLLPDYGEISGSRPQDAASATENTDTAVTLSGGANEGEIAHLVPASSLHASLYYNVALWVFGDSVENADDVVFQKLIHGSAENDRRGRRIEYTGLKHMICNKIRLVGQGRYYDSHPCLLIVPILSLEQAKGWNGEGYHALFLISCGTAGNAGKTKLALNAVAAGVLLLDRGDNASDAEIDLAEHLLSATTSALAFSLQKTQPLGHNKNLALSDNAYSLLKGLRKHGMVVTGEEKVLVPTRGQWDYHSNRKPVRKITFSPALSTSPIPEGTNAGHPAPDPILLAVKAAVNWSRFHEQKLLAAASVYDDDDYDDEQSIAAMEEYRAMHYYYHKSKQHEEIINMMITANS